MKWGFDRKTSQSCITKPKLGWFSDRSAYICIFNTWNRKKKERRHCINIGVLWWRRRRDLNPRCTFAHYSLSRGAPSATWVLLHRTGSLIKLYFLKRNWRRERDSNPRYLSVSLVFKTSAINRSAISPHRNQRKWLYHASQSKSIFFFQLFRQMVCMHHTGQFS